MSGNGGVEAQPEAGELLAEGVAVVAPRLLAEGFAALVVVVTVLYALWCDDK